MIKVCFNI